KYPLATITHLLNIFPPGVGLGYNIACSFLSMLMRSSLAAQAHVKSLRMVVPTFHIHAHNRTCQLSHHILMALGFGLEDLETCECVFAGSNAVAHLTQQVTAFHRQQFIDMYFKQWDANKYENLGQFLLNNYKQALEVLKEMPVQIEILTSGQEVTNLQYASWLEEE
ncbi:hypothetical protein K439DRAFT_1317871, partial [Ramaria rubella]